MLAAVHVLITIALAQSVALADGSATREEMARRLNAVQTGMSLDEVLSTCGPGFTIRYPGQRFGPEKGFVVGYGSEGPTSFPTLGRICFVDQKVTWVVGGSGTVIEERLVAEPQLRRLLSVLAERPPDIFAIDVDWWPRMLRCVNSLQPLGKLRAVAVLREAIRVSGVGLSDFDSLQFVLRLLFEPRRHAPNWPWDLPEPDDSSLLPHYPIAIIRGVPITFSGMPTSPSGSILGLSEAGFFEREGELIATPLKLPMNPFHEILAASDTPIWPSEKWWAVQPQHAEDVLFRFRRRVIQQLLSLCEGIEYPVPMYPTHDEWVTAVRFLETEFNASDLVWDPGLCKYVRRHSK
ncbi:MAG: hypothetical protein H0W86_02405 [Armatimonadetes bacterium]|nr:hypothetical protein [Armatimonadota bacterium]